MDDRRGFFTHPTKKWYLKGIAREIPLAHTSVAKNLGELKKEGLITESKEKRGTREFPLYSASLESHSYRGYKKIFNLLAVAESGLIEYIADSLMPQAVILFGSYRRGEDDEQSDVDLFVLGKRQSLHFAIYEKKLQRRVQLHFSEKFSAVPIELRNNLVNGIVLHGFIEAFK